MGNGKGTAPPNEKLRLKTGDQHRVSSGEARARTPKVMSELTYSSWALQKHLTFDQHAKLATVHTGKYLKEFYTNWLDRYSVIIKEAARQREIPAWLLASVILGECIDMSNSLRAGTLELISEHGLEWLGVGSSVGLAQIRVDTAIKFGLTPTARTNKSDESQIRKELISDAGSIRASAKYIRELAIRAATGVDGQVDQKLAGSFDWTTFRRKWKGTTPDSDETPFDSFERLKKDAQGEIVAFFGAAHNDGNVTGPYKRGQGGTQGPQNAMNAYTEIRSYGLLDKYGLLDEPAEVLEDPVLDRFCLSKTKDGSSPLSTGAMLSYRRKGGQYVLDQEVYLVAKFSGPYAKYFEDEKQLIVSFKATEKDVGGNERVTESWTEDKIGAEERAGGYCYSAFDASWLAYLIPNEGEAEAELDVELEAWCEIRAAGGGLLKTIKPITNATSSIKISREKLKFKKLMLSRTSDGSEPIRTGHELKYHKVGTEYDFHDEQNIYIVGQFSSHYADYFKSDHQLKILFKVEEQDVLGINEEYSASWRESEITAEEQSGSYCFQNFSKYVLNRLVPSSKEAEAKLKVFLTGSCEIKKGDEVLETLEPEENLTKHVFIQKYV